MYIYRNTYIYIYASTPHQIIQHKSFNTSLKPSVKGYSEILQVLKYLNNQNQIMKKHCKNVVTKQISNTYSQICSKINTRRKTQKIIWFNPPFSLNVKTNVAKMFLQLIDTHFPPANKLHKIFNRNTVKVSYNCTSQLIKRHNKKVTQIK